MIPEYDHYLVREIRILEDINHELEFENNKLRDDLYECQGLLEDCQTELKQIEEGEKDMMKINTYRRKNE